MSTLWDRANKYWDTFQKSTIGKFLIEKIFLRSKSFYSILTTYGLILVAQLSAYNSVTQWADKVDAQLSQSEGLDYALWFLLSFLVPEGNLALIIILILIIIGAWIVRKMELTVIKKPKELTGYEKQRVFIGRKKELEIISKALKGSSSLLLLNGIGGMGKTSLASYYLEIHKKKYKYYAFINGQNDVRLSLFQQFEKSLNLNKQESIEADFREVLGELRKLEGKTLLVIDDIKEVKKQSAYIDEILKLRDRKFQLLFTSRESIDNVQSYHLGVLDKQDAKELFNSIVEMKDERLLEKILDYVDYHTYFIELIAKTLKSNHSLTPKNLLKKFELGEFSRVNKSYEESFSLFLEKLFSFDQLDENAILQLKKLSTLPAIEIEFETLVTLLDVDEVEAFELLLNLLVERGWLIKNKNSYKLHQIIKEYILTNYTPVFVEIEIVVDSMNTLIGNSADIQVAVDNQENIVYFEGLATLLERLEVENEKVGMFFENFGNIYVSLCFYQRAESLYLKALKIRESILGEEHSSIATNYNNLAVLYKNMGEYRKAESLYLKALRIRENILGEEHPDTATSYNNLAGLYKTMGEYRKAEPLYIKALSIREVVLGEKHPNRASSYNNLAEFYRDIGEYRKAEPLYIKALKIWEEVLGEEHPDTASSYNNLAILYKTMREYRKAEPLYIKALKIWEEVLGEKHPNTASSYNNLAEFYRDMGEYRKAEPLYIKALNVWEEVLGEEHPDTASSYNNLAGLYRNMGEYRKAESLYLKALRIRESILGEEHPDTASSYNSLAVFYDGKGDFEKAYVFMKRATKIVSKVLPSKHPNLINSKEGLEKIEAKLSR